MYGIPLYYYMEDGHFTDVGIAWFIAGSVFCSTVEVASILNAIKVAKVKNLHLADLEKLEAGYSFTVSPTLLPTYTSSAVKPIPGAVSG